MLGASCRRAAVAAAISAFLCAFLLSLAPAAAEAHVAVRFSATLSPAHVLRVQGVVHLASRGLRARLQLKTQRAGRAAWTSLGASVPVDRRGSFVVSATVLPSDTRVVIRTVVSRGRRVLTTGSALLVRMSGQAVLGTKTTKAPAPPTPPSPAPGPGPTTTPTPPPPEPAPPASVLASGSKLLTGERLLSPDHQYELKMQIDGNLVLYHEGAALWATYTSGSGNYAAMQPDGNLVVYNGGAGLWNTSTWGFPGAELHLQDDGNLVVYQNGHAIWTYGSGYKADILNPNEQLQTGAYLLSPNHQYELVMQGDGNLVLYHGGSALWATYTSGAGNYAAMQSDGNLVVYNGGEARWNTVTWGFSGASLHVQDDGNVVVYQNGHAIWTYGGGYKGQILNPGEQLQTGAYLVSPNHQYELVMQGDGNLVLYRSGSALWATYTSGAGNYAAMQGDGNFVVYNGGTALWNSTTGGSGGAYLQLQDDSNLVIYQGGTALWDWESGKLDGGGGPNVGERILAQAEKWSGTPYCFAGGGPNGPSHGYGNVEGATQCGGSTIGFDCTGLTIYAVYQVTGKVLTHNASQAANAVSQGGQRIYSKSELQPGDLVYFGGSFNAVEHVGVYAGGGMMWDANIAFWIYPDGVRERSMASVETTEHFDGAVRF